MKRTTTLTGQSDVGKVTVTVKTNSKGEGLMRFEHDDRHEKQVAAVHEAMVQRGCWAHKIQVN